MNPCENCKGHGVVTPKEIESLIAEHGFERLPYLLRRAFITKYGYYPHSQFKKVCSRCSGTGVEKWNKTNQKEAEDRY